MQFAATRMSLLQGAPQQLNALSLTVEHRYVSLDVSNEH